MHKKKGLFLKIQAKGGRVDIKLLPVVTSQRRNWTFPAAIQWLSKLPITVSMIDKVGRQGADINFT